MRLFSIVLLFVALTGFKAEPTLNEKLQEYAWEIPNGTFFEFTSDKDFNLIANSGDCYYRVEGKGYQIIGNKIKMLLPDETYIVFNVEEFTEDAMKIYEIKTNSRMFLAKEDLKGIRFCY